MSRVGGRLVDLSHPVVHGQVTFPGLPAPVVRHHLDYEQSRSQVAAGRQFSADLLTVLGGTATYLDSPRHFFPDGSDVSQLTLEQLVDLPVTRVGPPSRGREYSAADFLGVALAGHALLLHTGYGEAFGTAAYCTGSPYVGEAAATFLARSGVALVGIDALLLDDLDDPDPRPGRPAHFHLLGAGVPIIENLTGLDAVPDQGARLSAVPAAVRDMGNFPVRAFARLP